MLSEGRNTYDLVQDIERPRHMLLLLIPIVWLAVIMLVLAMCRMAARADRQPTAARAQSPRRPITCGTVRSKILTSAQSDQLAMYK